MSNSITHTVYSDELMNFLYKQRIHKFFTFNNFHFTFRAFIFATFSIFVFSTFLVTKQDEKVISSKIEQANNSINFSRKTTRWGVLMKRF